MASDSRLMFAVAVLFASAYLIWPRLWCLFEVGGDRFSYLLSDVHRGVIFTKQTTFIRRLSTHLNPAILFIELSIFCFKFFLKVISTFSMIKLHFKKKYIHIFSYIYIFECMNHFTFDLAMCNFTTINMTNNYVLKKFINNQHSLLRSAKIEL